MKPDSSPISSQAMLDRQANLLAGRATPSTATDATWVLEMNAILDAGGLISVPTDLPDPISRSDADWHLAVDDDESEVKSVLKNPARFDWYGRDGDFDGQVQDGTPFERASRSNSHNAIGRGKRKLVRRLRLRDLPFPFSPPNVPKEKPPVAAHPEAKSALRPIRSSAIGRAIKPAKFDPDAIDGDNDGNVQDNTRFERPAGARAPKVRTVVLASGKKKNTGGKPSGGRVTPKKDAPTKIEPFRSRGRRDDVGSPNDLNSQRLKQLEFIGATKPPSAISEFFAKYAPFGGHRSKADGPHPALRRALFKLHKAAKDKYGELDTVAEMEAALKKAFPNAEVYLGPEVGLFRLDPRRVSAVDSYQITAPNLIAAIRRVGNVDDVTAREMLPRVQRSVALSLLGLAEQHPEVAEHVGYAGLTLAERPNILAFVAGDPRDHRKLAITFDPSALIAEAVKDPDHQDLLRKDRFFAGVITGSYWPPNEADLGVTSLAGITSDSDLDAIVAATAMHEWGHATGMRFVQEVVMPDMELIGFDNILFGDGPVDTSKAEWLAGLVDYLQGLRPEIEDIVESGSKKLAKMPFDLNKRMTTLGMPVPGNWMKATEDQRIAMSREVLRQTVRSGIMTTILLTTSDSATNRDMSNLALRSLGTYGLSLKEEAAAEMYLAWKLGLSLYDIVSQGDDPIMHYRIGSRS